MDHGVFTIPKPNISRDFTAGTLERKVTDTGAELRKEQVDQADGLMQHLQPLGSM